MSNGKVSIMNEIFRKLQILPNDSSGHFYVKDSTHMVITKLGRKLKKIITKVKHKFSDQFERANIL